jgi:hypothetical protein
VACRIQGVYADRRIEATSSRRFNGRMQRSPFVSWTIALGLSVSAAQSAGCSAAGTAEDGADAGPSIVIQGNVRAENGSVLAGVSICERPLPEADSDPDSCAVSDVAGSFTLSNVPVNALLSLTFRKDGFVPMLRSVSTEGRDLRLPEGENTLQPATVPQTFLGVATDPARGQIEFHVEKSSADAPEVDVTLTGVGGPAPDEATSRTVAGSVGGFANVRPGTYVLRFGDASTTCTPGDLYGLPITMYQPSGVAVLVVTALPGYVTAPIVVSCTGRQS